MLDIKTPSLSSLRPPACLFSLSLSLPVLNLEQNVQAAAACHTRETRLEEARSLLLLLLRRVVPSLLRGIVAALLLRGVIALRRWLLAVSHLRLLAVVGLLLLVVGRLRAAAGMGAVGGLRGRRAVGGLLRRLGGCAVGGGCVLLLRHRCRYLMASIDDGILDEWMDFFAGCATGRWRRRWWCLQNRR